MVEERKGKNTGYGRSYGFDIPQTLREAPYIYENELLTPKQAFDVVREEMLLEARVQKRMAEQECIRNQLALKELLNIDWVVVE